MFWIWSLALFCLSSCDSSPPSSLSTTWQIIHGRDEGNPRERVPIYQAKIPINWIQIENTASIHDTKKALYELLIQEGSEKVRITIHNFPTKAIEERIPSLAQIQRWKNQFDFLDPVATQVTHQSRGGFIGMFLECEGTYQEKPTKILGWSMQLASIYYRHLSFNDSAWKRQQRADYTIKALGPTWLMRKYREEIIEFANSFELIVELPSIL